jgi:YHS domain-containing protein
MNKFLAIATILSLFGTAAFAGPKTPTKIKCAVMPGNSVDVKAATKSHMYADYKGNRYFFCCEGCPETFKANKAKYAKAPHIKSPKSK